MKASRRPPFETGNGELQLGLLASIIESSNDAITSVSLNGIVTSWNPGAERMYGYLATEMMGQPVSRIFSPGNPYEVADIQKKITAGNIVEPYETLRIRKDGTTISISLTLSPIYDENGVVIGSSGIARDLTKEKQISQDFQNLAAIIESSNKSIISTNLDRILTSWNPASEILFGYTADEMIGQPIARIIPIEKREETNACFEKTISNIKLKPYKTLRLRKDGSTISISLTVSPIFDQMGAIIGVSGMSQDITQEEAASQYARNMASIIEHSNDSIISANLEGIIVSWNPTAERTFGYLSEEIVGQSISLIIPADNKDEFAEIQKKIRGGDRIDPYETLRIRKDGIAIPVSLTISLVYDDNGVVIGLSGISRDITAEKAASQNARNMASIIEYSNDAIISVNMAAIVTSWNPAAERLYGYSAEEMIGRPILKIVPPDGADQDPDSVSNLRSGHKIEAYEIIRIRKNGTPVEISLTLSPIYDESGVVIGTSGISRDITAEKEASQNARKMALIVESSNDAITSGNIDLIFTGWNPAAERMFGYSAAEIIGQPFSILSVPETLQEDVVNQRDISEGNRIEPYETLRLRKDGTTIPIFLTVSPIYDERGMFIGSSGIARDITQEKQIIHHLEEMNKVRNDFVTMVSHDIRSPMTSISGFANLLIERWNTLDEDDKKEYLNIIVRNTDNLSQFVEDVLQVARIEAGQYSYEINPLDIRALAQKTIDAARGQKNNQNFELISPNDLPLVLGDEERVYQVFANLISNALKYSPEQENIVIELSKVANSVQIAVKNFGPGISKSDIEKLFKKFGVAAANPLNQTVQSNGLGLFICKTLVEAQGGRIWCESVEGEATTFFFTIPVKR